MPNPTDASKKRQEEDAKEHMERQESRIDAERRRQQNTTQGMNTGTGDVQGVSDWGSMHSSKKKRNGRGESGTQTGGGNRSGNGGNNKNSK